MPRQFKKAEIGDYVIVNFWDLPCARLTAKVIEVSENAVVSEYICADVSMRTICSNPNDVRCLSDFGIEVQFISGGFVCVKNGESQVRYADGSIRLWQDAEFLKIQKLKNPLLARAVEKAICK